MCKVYCGSLRHCCPHVKWCRNWQLVAVFLYSGFGTVSRSLFLLLYGLFYCRKRNRKPGSCRGIYQKGSKQLPFLFAYLYSGRTYQNGWAAYPQQSNSAALFSLRHCARQFSPFMVLPRCNNFTGLPLLFAETFTASRRGNDMRRLVLARFAGRRILWTFTIFT